MVEGTAAFVLVLALCVVGLVLADLVRAADKDDSDATCSGGQWERRMSSCRDRVAKVVPLTSIKIVLVAWQIVTQVRRKPRGFSRSPRALSQAVFRGPKPVLAEYRICCLTFFTDNW